MPLALPPPAESNCLSSSARSERPPAASAAPPPPPCLVPRRQAIPPIFDSCTSVISHRDETDARDRYWRVVSQASPRRQRPPHDCTHPPAVRTLTVFTNRGRLHGSEAPPDPIPDAGPVGGASERSGAGSSPQTLRLAQPIHRRAAPFTRSTLLPPRALRRGGAAVAGRPRQALHDGDRLGQEAFLRELGGLRPSSRPPCHPASRGARHELAPRASWRWHDRIRPAPHLAQRSRVDALASEVELPAFSPSRHGTH